MHFAFSEEQESIRTTARELLERRFPVEVLQRCADPGGAPPADLWPELVELGWPGIYLPEEDGGIGLGVVELAILCDELGRALAPVPLRSTAAAGLLVDALGDEDQRARWLRPLATGTATATVAIADGDAPTCLDEGALTGTKIAVPDAGRAALLVVAVEGGFAAVPSDTDRVRVEPAPSLDLTRPSFSASFDAAPAAPLCAGDPERAVCALTAVLAAECAGVAHAALEATVSYAKDRRQFGVPIGAFQAVAHRCAEMLRDAEGARAAAYAAAWACDHDPERAVFAAHVATGCALDAAVRTCESAIQVHGGVGFTWEHHLHLLLRRAQTNAHALGTADDARSRVAELILIGV